MDFMNFMNQFGGSNFNSNCECNSNHGCLNNNNKFNDFLPLLLLGMGQCGSNQFGGNLTCYPNNNFQQFSTPTPYSSCCPNIKYRKRKVKQAYVEMPVSTYQVVQPFFSSVQHPTTMNIMPNGLNRNNDLLTLILFMMINRSRSISNHQNVGCGGPSEI